jgi:hypothetical protein
VSVRLFESIDRRIPGVAAQDCGGNSTLPGDGFSEAGALSSDLDTLEYYGRRWRQGLYLLRAANRANPICNHSRGVDDRIRTGDRLDHNQELYQLSYIHRARRECSGRGGAGGGGSAADKF